MRKLLTCSLMIVQAFIFNGLYAQNINTIIGGLGDGGMATAAELLYANDVAVDKSGNIYVADNGHYVVRKIDAAGIITIFAGVPGSGGGGGGSVGDGGPAIFASLSNTLSIAADTFGNLFISDGSLFGSVRKVDKNGIITTYAGGGGSSSEDIPATSARLQTPTAIAVDITGNLYIIDDRVHKIRKVNTSGIIKTIAGSGVSGFYGDGYPATIAKLNQTSGICADRTGNVFITDNNRIRKIDTFGIITTIGGNGGVGSAGDGGPALSANLNGPKGICTDNTGNVYFADNANSVVRKISAINYITSVVGTLDSAGFSGDGGPATAAKLSTPTGITFDNSGNLFVVVASRIRKVNTSNIISTIAGSGFSLGDGGPAISALLNNPLDICYDATRNLYIADFGNHCIRKVDLSGIISTYAGNDTSGNTGDGGIATHAKLAGPASVLFDKKGNLFICDMSANCIRRVNNSGIISTYAGRGSAGYGGDGQIADSAKFNSPSGIGMDRYGNLYIADRNNNRIRKVDTNRIVTTVAGNGIPGYFGDGGLASSAQINLPYQIYLDDTANIYIADYANSKIRKINTAGIITTYAGNGSTYSGDGGPAASAGIDAPTGIVIDKSGNLYFSSNSNYIRKVNSAGIISTFAGTGSGFFGDGGPAISAKFNSVYGLLFDTSGDLLIADYNNSRIREIYNAKIIISTPYDSICTGYPATYTAVASAASIYSLNYHWTKNNIPVGTDNVTYVDPGPSNGDVVKCIVSNGPTGINIATSNSLSIHILSFITPGVSITASPSSPMCQGTTVTCNPTPVNGGTSPTYDWYLNGSNIFTGSKYIFTPANGDSVRCILTSNAYCLLHDTALSGAITFTVTANASPSVSFTVNPKDTVCPGTTATCFPTVINGGSSPRYYWYRNDTLVQIGTPYTFTPNNGDTVYCKVSSNLRCVFPDTALSGKTKFVYADRLSPSVSFKLNPGDTICAGTNVACTATVINGGTNPQYAWHKNGVFTRNGPTYNFTPSDGDVVYCWVSSNYSCLTTDTADSRPTVFHVNETLVPSVSVSISPGSILCAGTAVECTPTGVNTGTTPVYNWYLNSTNVFTGNVYDFTPADGDNLYCQLTSNAVCASPQTANSPQTIFTTDTLPGVTITSDPGPVVFRGTPVTFRAQIPPNSIPVSYQWVKNGIPVPGATDAAYYPTSFTIRDSVYCTITAADICTGTVTSNTLYIDTYHGMALYPNPNKGDFTISLDDFNANGDNVDIHIFDCYGKEVYEKKAVFNVMSFNTEINLGRRLPPGVYVARLIYHLSTINMAFEIK